MKRFANAVLLVCVGLASAWSQDAKPATPSTSETLKQIEHDWTDAEKAGDTDKISALLGDDWVGLAPDGTTMTKKQFLDAVKSGELKMESMDIGPMHVKLLGTVAVVQGTDTEKSSFKGKDTSGKSAWMDVFAKRDGKWVAVRSQTASIK